MSPLEKVTNPISCFLSKPKTSGMLLFVFLFSILNFITFQRYQFLKESETLEMSNILKVVDQNIDQTLKNSYVTTLTLALTIDNNGIPNNFNGIAKELIDSYPNTDVVQLVPNGVIKYIYPLKGNEPALNFDILDSPMHRKAAQKAIEQKKIYFGGPIKLKQGGTGIVGRLPVFIKGKFWGFSAVVIKLENFLKITGLENFENDKYYFQFSKINPNNNTEEFFLPVREDFTDKDYQAITIPDGDWKFYLIPVDNYQLIKQLIPFSLLAIILSAICGIFTTILLKRPSKLERLVHLQAEKLMQSEIKFKSIFEQAAIGISRLDSNTGIYIETNEKFCQLVGYDSDEIKKMTFMILTHPEDLDEDLKNLSRLRKGEIREYSIEKRYFHKNGKIIWTNLTVSPLWDEDEKPSSHIAIVEDITEKKLAEDQLKKSKKRFESLFNNAPFPLWEEDFSQVKIHLEKLNLIRADKTYVLDYFKNHPEEIRFCLSLVKVIDVNKMGLIFHHVKNKSFLKDLNTIFSDDTLPIFEKQLLAITQGESRFNGEFETTTLDRKSHHISIKWRVVPEFKKSLKRVIISTENITERKLTEEINIKHQQKIESLINTIDGIVWEADPETFKFTFISKKVEQILGYTPEEWLANPDFWAQHLHPEDRDWAVTFYASNAKDKEQYDFEYRMIAKDGEIVWFRDIVSVLLKNDAVIKLRGIMINITQTKIAEIDLINTLHLVTEQNKRLLDFSYIVSHNLRSHTSNIDSLTNLIEAADTDKEREEMIQMLKSVSSILNETMDNLNEVVNMQTNINVHIESLNLKNHIKIIVALLSEQILKNNVIITISVDENVTINYNSVYLESILLNFISNAIRFRHPERQPEISLKSYQEEGKTVLEISDNGIGIDLERHGSKLFGMFKTFTKHPDARGIGLFITKNQIDSMGGKLTVESTLNKGTTFKIYFK
jgi:PAS domain S-box-containing protein